eukprot:5846071-Prymnesium_polylepis.1
MRNYKVCILRRAPSHQRRDARTHTLPRREGTAGAPSHQRAWLRPCGVALTQGQALGWQTPAPRRLRPLPLPQPYPEGGTAPSALPCPATSPPQPA